jgi:soluble lytic murein transglycosylase-like protein
MLPNLKPSPSKARRVTAYDELIATVAAQNQLPAALIHAVVKVESSYNPNAVSPKGAVGLMQLMPGTAERFGVTDATDPAANLSGGAQYLRKLLVLFEYDLSLALAGYNAGENAVLKYKRQIPPYPETQAYVKKVMGLYQQYLMQTL